jgi:hypothetical protein
MPSRVLVAGARSMTEAWHCVDPRDVARLIRLALQGEKPRFAVYFNGSSKAMASEAQFDLIGLRNPAEAAAAQ